VTIRLGATPSGLTSAHLHHLPIFFMGRMPFLPPNQQCQSTEGISLHTLRAIKTQNQTSLKTVSVNDIQTADFIVPLDCSALTLLVGWQEGHPAHKKYGEMVEVGTG